MIIMMVPCIGLYILEYRCNEAWESPTASGWPDSASPIVCLTPGTYGIPAPKYKPDVKVCQQRFNDLCTLVRDDGKDMYKESYASIFDLDESFIKICLRISWFIFCCFGSGMNFFIEIHK